MSRGHDPAGVERAASYLVRVNEPAESMSPSPIVRAATNDDVLALAQVHIASWRETYAGLLPEPMLTRLSISGAAIRRQRMLDHPRAHGRALIFVAEHQGEVIGYGSCNDQRAGLLHARGFTGEVSELYVLSKAQRQGAGTQLMAAMARALVERGHRGYSLWVVEQNAAARQFYERLRGILIAERRDGVSEVAYGWRGPAL